MPRLDDDALADVPRPDGLRDREAVADVTPLRLVGHVRGERPHGGEDTVEEEGRGDDGDAVVFELRGDAAQDGVVAETGQTGKELLAALVRREVLEQCLLADAAGHDRLGDAGGAEGVDDAAELADLDPGHRVDRVADLGQRFALVGDRDDLDAGGARRAREDQREAAVAGDESDAWHRAQG